METVKVSPKFQVVIPKKVAKNWRFAPARIADLRLDGTIRLNRPGSIKDLPRIAKGIKWKDEDRDHTERF